MATTKHQTQKNKNGRKRQGVAAAKTISSSSSSLSMATTKRRTQKHTERQGAATTKTTSSSRQAVEATTKSAVATTSDTKRKEKLSQYGIDLPDIPGLPVEVIPLHIHAVKVTAKLFSKNGLYQSKVLLISEKHGDDNNDHDPMGKNARTNATAASQSGSGVLDSILQRVDEQVSSAAGGDLNESSRRLENQQQMHRFHDGVASWLNAIHRFVRDNHSRRSRPAENGGTVDNSTTTNKMHVAVAALQHLWEVGMDHKRMAVRRATLYLMGQLFEKSADCRKWLLEETSNIMKWMNAFFVTTTSQQEAVEEINNEHDASVRLWQREAFHLLNYLDSKGYGDYYPTLSVAVQRFEQKCPGIRSELLSSSLDRPTGLLRNMVDWRELRDQAMQHCESIVQKVQRLAARAQRHMDVLVPRMDVAVPAGEPNGGLEDDADDDEDNIDWEDGWDEDEENITAASNHPSITHADAVERTLEAMSSTGGLLEGGLEICLNGATEPQAAQAISNTPAAEQAQVGLKKIVQILSSRYMPRLTLWVEGLINADGLVKSSSLPLASSAQLSNYQSLLEMSSTARMHRKQVLQQCVGMKQEVARILTAATRLGLMDAGSVAATTNANAEPRSHRRLAMVADLVGERQNSSLAATLSRKRSLQQPTQDFARKRSNRIQIKFNKR